MLDTDAAERFRLAVELHETGMALMRQNLRRRHPHADDAEIEALLRAWCQDRPADAPGRPRPQPA